MSNEAQSLILLVDDDTANLNFLVDELLENGFQLMVAKSGEIALERASMQTPDIILLDVRMPGIDGFETCRRLKANPILNPIPVIFLSAANDIDDKAQGLLSGGVDYITKPLEIEEVLLRIHTHLKIRQLQLNMEQRVEHRTLELRSEIDRRIQSERQQTILLEIVRTQGAQLQLMTKQLLDMQLRQRTELGQALDGEVLQHLVSVNARMLTLMAQIQNKKVTEQFMGLNRELQRIQSVLHDVTSSLSGPLSAEALIQDNPLLKLSDREREVIQLIINRYSTPEIGQVLHVSKSTVRSYRHRIMKKLGVNSEDELLRLVVKHNLNPSEPQDIAGYVD